MSFQVNTNIIALVDRTCEKCKARFAISSCELEFLEKVAPLFANRKFALPPPKFCPDCRYQQRLTWRNERQLYRRACSATNEEIVSIFSPDKSWPPVYKQDYWWSDNWDPKSYGQEFDFSRPFFEQFAELFRAVPQLALNNQKSENCMYTNQWRQNIFRFLENKHLLKDLVGGRWKTM